MLHTSPSRYLKSLEHFDDECTNMIQFLRWYNLLDCHLLCEAIAKYSRGFVEEWDTNVHDFKSVSKFFFSNFY